MKLQRAIAAKLHISSNSGTMPEIAIAGYSGSYSGRFKTFSREEAAPCGCSVWTREKAHIDQQELLRPNALHDLRVAAFLCTAPAYSGLTHSLPSSRAAHTHTNEQ